MRRTKGRQGRVLLQHVHSMSSPVPPPPPRPGLSRDSRDPQICRERFQASQTVQQRYAAADPLAASQSWTPPTRMLGLQVQPVLQALRARLDLCQPTCLRLLTIGEAIRILSLTRLNITMAGRVSSPLRLLECRLMIVQQDPRSSFPRPPRPAPSPSISSSTLLHTMKLRPLHEYKTATLD